MDINFHYAAVKVLAHHAGFSKQKSQIIAYASQQVDDAARHQPMALDRDPQVDGIRFEDNVFDPICTAHKDLDYVRGALSRRGRLRVYVCFHFLPSLVPPSTEESFWRAESNDPLARQLVEDALEELAGAVRGPRATRALIRLGIALHSYADTWAHQGFSGQWDSDNNDISDLRIKVNNTNWAAVDPASKVLSYAMPDIGHAEAGTLPDRSNVTWECAPPKRSSGGRSNCTEFLNAAEEILDLLSGATGKGRPWAAVRGGLRECFMRPAVSEDFRPGVRHAWSRRFPGLGFHYDEKAWFAEALQPTGGLLDLMGAGLAWDPEDFELLNGRDYFYFHAAAKGQRETVLKEIRGKSEGAVSLF